MTKSARQAVVGDIGATQMRFAIADIDELKIDQYVLFRRDMFSTVEDGLNAYLESVPGHPEKMCLAANDHIPSDSVGKAKGIKTVHQLNDLDALAHSLPFLSGHDVLQIGGGTADKSAAKVVIDAGTQLRADALLPRNGTWTTLPGKGGGMAFAPATAEESGFLGQMFPGAVFVSYENVLSTNGLMKLYQILLQRNGLPQTTQDASAIIVAAQEGTDRAAVDSLEYYGCWLGRFAGDLALLYDARGGLYLGGGIPPKIIEFLNAGKFRTAFEAKGELAPYLGQIPVYVIRAADAGLRGAALALGALKN